MCHVFLFQSSCLFAWATKDCNKKSSGAPAKDMFGKPHGTFGIPSPSPLFRVSFAVSTAKSPFTFMPLKPHCALATWSSKEAGNSKRRMIFILGKPFGKQHCQKVPKSLLDHVRPKAQVVHHSLLSMNAIPPAPVSSSSWRLGLLVAKIAVAQATRKHEHMRSIKTPEKEAPSFSSRTSI